MDVGLIFVPPGAFHKVVVMMEHMYDVLAFYGKTLFPIISGPLCNVVDDSKIKPYLCDFQYQMMCCDSKLGQKLLVLTIHT